MRKFEKISFKQYCKDIGKSKIEYEKYLLPVRSTKYSAGYDFFAIKDICIKPGEIIKIPTGYKVILNNDEMLMIVVRSSMGFKYNVRLCNQVGIIESDYYNNKNNEGHMFVALQNEGNEEVMIKSGQGYAQGIFIKFLTVDNEKEITIKRTGGFGSTTCK